MTLPAVGAKLNSPDHRLFHRIIDLDPAASDSVIAVNSADEVGISTAPATNIRTLIKGKGATSSTSGLRVLTSGSLQSMEVRDNGATVSTMRDTTGTALQGICTNASFAGNGIVATVCRAASAAFDLMELQTDAGTGIRLRVNGEGRLEVFNLSTTSEGIDVNCTNGSYTGSVISGDASRVANSAYNLLRLRSDADGTPVDEFVVRGDARTAIGPASFTGKLNVDQDSATGAIPVLFLDQADVSEEMIEFASTIGVGNAIEAIGAKTLTTTHFIKVTITGGLTRYIPVGTIA